MSDTIIPVESYWNKEDRTTRLFFDEGSKFPDGNYAINGGITFPLLVDAEIVGAAIVVGHHIDTGHFYVLAETRFATVEHFVDDDMGITRRGLSYFLNRTWARYYLRRIYYHQDYDSRRRCMRQIRKSESINPKPKFVDVDWVGDDFNMMLPVYEADHLGKLKYLSSSAVMEEMSQHNADPDKMYPTIHALNCVLSGMERRPYRPPAL